MTTIDRSPCIFPIGNEKYNNVKNREITRPNWLGILIHSGYNLHKDVRMYNTYIHPIYPGLLYKLSLGLLFHVEGAQMLLLFE